MPNCINDNKKTYTGKEPSPKGLGYSAAAEPVNKIMNGKDGNYYINKQTKTSKRWTKLNELVDLLDNLPSELHNTAFIPSTKKIKEETGIEEKFGGKKPFFVKGEKWPSKDDYHMTFFCQLKDPRKNDKMLYRVFILIDDEGDGCMDDYWITKIELSDENIKNQVIIEKPEYSKEFMKENRISNEIFEPYEIKSWSNINEIVTYDRLKKYFHIPDYKYKEDNTLYNDFMEAFDMCMHKPSSGIKVGGTPLSTQDQEYVQQYNFLQIEETRELPYMWGDCGIAHVSDDCELTWDCC